MHFATNPLAVFVIQAIVIIATARIIGLGARRLGQPMVVAEITAGIVLGPSVLGALSPAIEKGLFPATSYAALSLTSQAGLLLFMFIIGLELDPKLLRGRARSSVAISHASIVLPFLLGSILAFRLHGELAPPGVPLSSFTLFLGIAMSITAFPVLARILVERRLLRSRVGAIAISCAAVDDVTAWCLLAVVVSIVRSATLLSAGLTIASALVYIAVMLFVVRPFLARLAERTRIGLNQNFVALVIIAVFFSSLVTEMIGIHALFGAFLFGAVMPKHGSLAVALAEKMEDLVVVLFLPLFFAFSGLRTQIGLLDTPSSWLICGVIVLAACMGKFGGSVIAARLTGIPWREANAIGILMNTRGLMELIVLNIGLDLGLLSPRLFAMMVIMALVTTFMTSPLLQRIYPVERFLQEIEGDETPVSNAAAFTVLACLSQEGSAPGLVNIGVALAGDRGTGGQLYGLRLASSDDRASVLLGVPGDARDNDLPADAALDAAITRARALNAKLRPVSFVSTSPAKDICAVSNVKRAQVILLGWHRPLFRGNKLGGVVEEVLSIARRDVAVFFDHGFSSVKRVLIAFGGTDEGRAALRLGSRIAMNTGARIDVLCHASSEEDVERVARDARAELVMVDNRKLEVHTEVGGDARHVLSQKSRGGYDLLVVAIKGLWGIDKTAVSDDELLRGAGCSVLAVRGFTRDRDNSMSDAPLDPAEAARYSTLRPPT